MFKWQPFKSHAGKPLSWKIECDDLTQEDIDCLADIISMTHSYRNVEHPPTKSANLINLVSKLALRTSPDGDYDYLIIDDVLTTGKSMEDIYRHLYTNHYKKTKGVVIFARSECPDWITPIFQLNKIFDF
jgi:hypoxanthine-guanine phosphoribosyltransferase